MFNFIKKLKCKHIYIETISNLYGDAINRFNARRISKCRNCGKLIYLDYIDPNCNKVNFIIYD